MLSWLITANKIKCISLIYHTVSDKTLPHLKGLYNYRNTKQFVADLNFLLRFFSPVSLTDFIGAVQTSKPFKKPSFLLTFDDGFSEIYHVVAPILEARGIPAVFFINSAFIDNHNLFFRCKTALLMDALKPSMPFHFTYNDQKLKITTDFLKHTDISHNGLLDALADYAEIDFNAYLKTAQPFLTLPQIKHLTDHGFFIGSHSSHHPYFYHLDSQQQIAAIVHDTEEISRSLNLNYKVFAFPFSDLGVPSEVFSTVYESGIDLTFSTAGLKTDVFNRNIHRIPAENFSSVDQVLWFQYLYYLVKIPFHRNIRYH